jgi:excisionase family DNA binding protein
MNKSSRRQSAITAEAAQGTTAQEFEPILTLEEMAAKLKLQPSQLYELTRKRCRNPLPYLKCGKWLRFRLSDVDTWLKGRAA